MRDSIVFYRSFYEAIKEIPLEEQAVVYNAIYGYALDDVEPELTGIAKAIFLLVKPQIDANNTKYENGKKGGKPKTNQTETKTKPNSNQTETESKPNVNVNENVNDNDLKEEVVQEEKPTAAGWVSCYENNIGLVPPMVVEEINSYELVDEVVEEAIKEAVRCDARKPKYICAILRDFVEHNIKTKADVEARRVEREKNKPKNKDRPPDKPTSAYVNPAQKEFEDLSGFYAN